MFSSVSPFFLLPVFFFVIKINIDGPILDLTEKKNDEMSLVDMKLIALVLKKNTSVKCLKRGDMINIPIHGGIDGDDEVIEELSLLSSKDLEPIDGMIIGIGLMFNTTLTKLNLIGNKLPYIILQIICVIHFILSYCQ